MHDTSAAQVPVLPTAAFDSPQPTRPLATSIRTRAMSKLAIRPKSDTCWRSVGIGTDSQQASTLRMIIVTRSSDERQQRGRALLDEHAVEAFRQEAAAVVDDELHLLRTDVDWLGFNGLGVPIGRRTVDRSDELDGQGAVVVDVIQRADDRRPIESAHSASHSVVVRYVEIPQPRADGSDRL